jgi:hypothetical protein
VPLKISDDAVQLQAVVAGAEVAEGATQGRLGDADGHEPLQAARRPARAEQGLDE